MLCLLAFTLPFATSVANVASAQKTYESTLPNTVNLSVDAYGIKDNESSVSILTKDNQKNVTVTMDPFAPNQIQCTSYNWRNVKYFKISLAGKENLEDNCTIKYSVIYIPTEIEGTTLNAANAAQQEAVVYSQTEVQKTQITDEIYFFVDDNIDSFKTTSMKVAISAVDKDVFGSSSTSEFSYVDQGGWGTYLFCFSYEYGSENLSSYSELSELVPTKLNDQFLQGKELKVVELTRKSSSTSLNDAFVFTVNEPYRYVVSTLNDTEDSVYRYIKWFVSGTSTDGDKYVLCPADTTESAENVKTLYASNNIKRMGARFTLDTQIQGKWTVTAQIVDSPNSPDVKSATSEEVSTIKPFSTSAIIWISVGVGVAALITVITIIVVNIKKERTW